MKRAIEKYLIITGIACVVLLLWQDLELYIDGVITPRKVDDIIGFILVLSLYGNFQGWIKNNCYKIKESLLICRSNQQHVY